MDKAENFQMSSDAMDEEEGNLIITESISQEILIIPSK